MGGTAGLGYADEGERATGALMGAAIGGGAGAALPAAGRTVTSGAKHLLGLTSGTGAPAIELAYAAAKEGGKRQQLLVKQMRGGDSVPIDDVVDTAKDALKDLRQQASARYGDDIERVFAQTRGKSRLTFAAIRSSRSMTRLAEGTFEGMETEASNKVRQKVTRLLDRYEGAENEKLFTVEGMHHLRQGIGELMESAEFGSPERRKYNQIYHTVRDAISEQAPEYGDTLGRYATAKADLDEVQKALSLGDKTMAETALKKLQLSMRDSVASAQGSRRDAVRMLDTQSGNEIMPRLAGRTFSGVTPRGLGGLDDHRGARVRPWARE